MQSSLGICQSHACTMMAFSIQQEPGRQLAREQLVLHAERSAALSPLRLCHPAGGALWVDAGCLDDG